MKLIKMFQGLNQKFSKNRYHHLVFKILSFLLILTPLYLSLWYFANDIVIYGYKPFITGENRAYFILALILILSLKILLFDADKLSPYQYKDPKLQSKLLDIQQRFYSAFKFLKKTKINRTKPIKLIELPFYLFFGPTAAGKTALLAHSGVNFILHNPNLKTTNQPSANLDWWVTKDINIMDVPGYFLQQQIFTQKDKKITTTVIWDFFLYLLKSTFANKTIQGIVIALPIAEWMSEEDTQKAQAAWLELKNRLIQLHQMLHHPIACHFVLTKCDLIPGFCDFFAESTQEEINQICGVHFNQTFSKDLSDTISHKLDELIKKINLQLLSRLHHERILQNRAKIKDFPLQIEKMKQYFINQLLQQLPALPKITVQGIYLTSALQSTYLSDKVNEETTPHAIQLFKQPVSLSRPYFIKHVITHALPVKKPILTLAHKSQWIRRAGYATSIALIGITSIYLGRDFEQGVKYAYGIQNQISDYQLVIQPITNPEAHLTRTVVFLDTLEKATKTRHFKLDLEHLLNFYSRRTQQKASTVYLEALQEILLPETRNYLAEYLKNPVNKNAGNVYAMFTSYLMLGDKALLDKINLLITLDKLLPSDIAMEEKKQLLHHLDKVLSLAWTPLSLDNNLILELRKYFTAMPSFQLAYIILKNNENYIKASDINFDTLLQGNRVFQLKPGYGAIPNMFTHKMFNQIMTQTTASAAMEALRGNQVLGSKNIDLEPTIFSNLNDQLKNAYINNFVNTWESILQHITIQQGPTLAELDKKIIDLISIDSPLLQIVNVVFENTYFEPVTTTSITLQNLGQLLDKKIQPNNVLFNVFSSLQALHQYIQEILMAPDESKAAFIAVSTRMRQNGQTDAITQLRLMAEQSPTPIKTWLQAIADNTWDLLMQSAGGYLDVSWRQDVYERYLANIKDKYPFSKDQNQEVAIRDFIAFFGKPGVLYDYYAQYLNPLIDTSESTWHWKKIDGKELPYSETTLRQIQHAMRIQRIFFPNDDNKLNIQFALQAHKIDKNINSVEFNINEKKFIDTHHTKESHQLTWPNNADLKIASIKLSLDGNKTILHDFSGEWGLFKLVSQCFDSVITKKEMMVNFSFDNKSVKYLMFIDEQHNPFISLNLKHFNLADRLMKA